MNYIVSKRTDGKIQIVLSDDDGVQSSKVTAEVFADLNSGMYTAQFTADLFAELRTQKLLLKSLLI